MTHSPEPIVKPRGPTHSAEHLHLIGDELEALSSEIKTGEPQPKSTTLRGRFALSLKRRLYRLLWWHSYQIKAAVDLISRWTGEERRVIDDILEKIQDTEKRQSSDTSRFVQQMGQITQHLQAESSLREQLVGRLSHLNQKIDAAVMQSQQLAAGLSDLTQQLASRFSELNQKIDAESQQLASRLSSLGLLTNQTRESLSIQDRRLTIFIEEARKRLPEPLARETLQRMVDDQVQHRYDSLYAAFEDVFRGSREDIKSRQSVYLPFLKEHSIGSPAMPLLDLGCGRGEWLELLGEHGLQARGVDSNEAMIERCRSFGLQVEPGDSLVYLGTLPDECVGAVTAFHMVEHMPFDVVLKLIDEILRVLKPGGIVILETPNPANFLVGAYTFHLDPTHLKPLPSPLLRFFVEGRGFCGVHVRELHPYPDAVRLPDDSGGVASRFNDCLYGPQDYAVIGRKPF